VNELPYTLPGGQQVEFTPYRIGGKQGGAAEVTGSGAIQSENFSTGVSGWRILGNGDVEFNDGVFRGSLEAGTIDIGGDDTTSFHVDADGYMWMGATEANKLTAPFRVTSDGNLTANNATLTGTLRTGVTGPRVHVGGTSSAFVDLYSGDPDELDSGYINVSVDNTGPSDFAFINLVAPAMSAGQRAYIDVRHYDDGLRQIFLLADEVGIQGDLEAGGNIQGDLVSGNQALFLAQNLIPTPNYTAGWGDYGLPYFGLGGESDGFGRVSLRGLTGRDGAGLAAGQHVIATLPVDFRPLHQHLFNVRGFTPAGGETSMRLDVLTNGNCVGHFSTAVATGSYISFSGVSFQSNPF